MVAVEGSIIGLLTVADKVKSNAPETIRELKGMVDEVLLLTDDNHDTANSIA